MCLDKIHLHKCEKNVCFIYFKSMCICIYIVLICMCIYIYTHYRWDKEKNHSKQYRIPRTECVLALAG